MTIFIKNSSEDINFGTYELDARILTEGGRVFKNKEYKAELFVDEKKGKLTIVVYDDSNSIKNFKRKIN